MHFFPKLSFTIRHYTTLRKLPKLQKIPIKRRSQAILLAQQALIEYLHSTRSIPFTHAENITKNSLVSLSDLISKVDFSPQTFSRSFPRFLRYHPIDEFDFFFESIGIPYWEIKGFFGFPWNKLGKLYEEESLVFDEDPDGWEGEVRGEIDELLGVLKRVFVDCGGRSLVEGNVDACGMDASKEDIGLVLLRWPVILSYDLESPVFSVEGFLTSIGLSSTKLDSISWEFPFVLGKNKLKNLPYLLRAIDLHEWFFEKIMNGDHHLLAGVNNGSLDDAVENEFKKGLEKIKSRREHGAQLQERFNLLLNLDDATGDVGPRVTIDLGQCSEKQIKDVGAPPVPSASSYHPKSKATLSIDGA
ncbi:hypothetical protein Syun_018505 [Stephania yunnanensis]|uniref:Uncharacterized protein n=1 Tax=Stephania yunnanensis TaxID=152371 RepID=A0AAP0ITW3_9MAGN